MSRLLFLSAVHTGVSLYDLLFQTQRILCPVAVDVSVPVSGLFLSSRRLISLWRPAQLLAITFNFEKHFFLNMIYRNRQDCKKKKKNFEASIHIVS